MIADIFITTKGREDLLVRSLRSLKENTRREDYRLTLVVDTGFPKSESTLDAIYSADDSVPLIDHQIVHRENMGLGPSINQALSFIDSLKKWDGSSAPLLTIYCQDDIVYTKDWLRTISTKYIQLKGTFNLGFASGAECPEHPVRKDIGNGLMLKDWIRATNMVASHEYWMSMWPISRIDPETGRERGRPHNGLGSSVDWWFIRNAENSVCRTGRTNLVIPGLVLHAGYKESTWLDRDLPESQNDLKELAK